MTTQIKPEKEMLIISNSLPYFNAHKADLFSGLQKNWKIRLLTGETQSSLDKGKLSSQFELIPMSLSRYKQIALVDFKAFKKTLKVLKENKTDLVVSFTMKANLLAAFSVWVHNKLGRSSPKLIVVFPGLGRIFDRKKNSFMHKTRRKIIVLFYRWTLNATDAIAVFENADDQKYWENEKILPPDRTKLKKGTGVTIPEIRISKSLKGPLIVVFASRLLKAKGILLFIEAAKKFENNKNIKFILFGGVDNSESDRVTIDKTKLPTNIDFRGERTIEVVLSTLETAHCVCLPTTYMEGVPRILLEAASMKCALIASDISGCRDIIEHQKNGFLCNAENEKKLLQELISSVDYLASNRQLCIDIGTNAQKFIQENGYDSQSVKNSFQHILNGTQFD